MFNQSLLNNCNQLQEKLMPEAAGSLLYNYDQNQTILCRSRAERNFLENMESL